MGALNASVRVASNALLFFGWVGVILTIAIWSSDPTMALVNLTFSVLLLESGRRIRRHTRPLLLPARLSFLLDFAARTLRFLAFLGAYPADLRADPGPEPPPDPPGSGRSDTCSRTQADGRKPKRR